MRTSFPILDMTTDANGNESYVLDIAVFYDLFLTVAVLQGLDDEMVRSVTKQFNDAMKKRKKRLQLKKQKQVGVRMYEIIDGVTKEDE